MKEFSLTNLASTCSLDELLEAIRLKFATPESSLSSHDSMKYIDRSIEELDLSQRVFNRLKRFRVLTLSSLVKCSRTDLLGFSGFGKNCLLEVETCLKNHGRSPHSERRVTTAQMMGFCWAQVPDSLRIKYEEQLKMWGRISSLPEELRHLNDWDPANQPWWSDTPYIDCYARALEFLLKIGKIDPVGLLAQNGFPAP